MTVEQAVANLFMILECEASNEGSSTDTIAPDIKAEVECILDAIADRVASRLQES